MKKVLVVGLCLIMSLYGHTQTNQMDAKGLRQGIWKKRFENGKMAYEGVFKDDVPVGEMKRYDQEGKLSSILTYTAGVDKVAVQMFHPNGKKMATGDYINKERVGLWEIYSIGGISKGSMNYSAGKLDGLSVTKYKNGMAADSSEYKADKRHGTRKEFFSDGKIKKESNYLEGNLNGRLAIYFANGKIKVSGRYDSAKRDGLWVIYDEKQRILKYQLYRNGKEVSENENMKLLEKE